jgi:hypothetical protein
MMMKATLPKDLTAKVDAAAQASFAKAALLQVCARPRVPGLLPMVWLIPRLADQ